MFLIGLLVIVIIVLVYLFRAREVSTYSDFGFPSEAARFFTETSKKKVITPRERVIRAQIQHEVFEDDVGALEELRQLEAIELDQQPTLMRLMAPRTFTDVVGGTKKMKLQEMVMQTQNKHDAAKAFLGSLETFDNDAQNVHDTAVGDSMKNIYDRIRVDADQRFTPEAVSVFVNETYAPDDISVEETEKRKNRAMGALRRIGKDDYIMKVGAKLSDILSATWARASTSPQIAESVVNALADSAMEVNDGGATRVETVCANGIAGRLLGALEGIDESIEDIKIIPYDAHKNEIYNYANKTLTAEIEIAKPEVANYYNSNGPATPALEEFKQGVMGKIEEFIDSYEGVNDQQRNILKRDCLIVVDI